MSVIVRMRNSKRHAASLQGYGLMGWRCGYIVVCSGSLECAINPCRLINKHIPEAGHLSRHAAACAVECLSSITRLPV